MDSERVVSGQTTTVRTTTTTAAAAAAAAAAAGELRQLRRRRRRRRPLPKDNVRERRLRATDDEGDDHDSKGDLARCRHALLAAGMAAFVRTSLAPAALAEIRDLPVGFVGFGREGERVSFDASVEAAIAGTMVDTVAKVYRDGFNYKVPGYSRFAKRISRGDLCDEHILAKRFPFSSVCKSSAAESLAMFLASPVLTKWACLFPIDVDVSLHFKGRDDGNVIVFKAGEAVLFDPCKLRAPFVTFPGEGTCICLTCVDLQDSTLPRKAQQQHKRLRDSLVGEARKRRVAQDGQIAAGPLVSDAPAQPSSPPAASGPLRSDAPAQPSSPPAASGPLGSDAPAQPSVTSEGAGPLGPDAVVEPSVTSAASGPLVSRTDLAHKRDDAPLLSPGAANSDLACDDSIVHRFWVCCEDPEVRVATLPARAVQGLRRMSVGYRQCLWSTHTEFPGLGVPGLSIRALPRPLDTHLVTRFLKHNVPVQKIKDLVAFWILYLHGGWFFDMDVFVFRPLPHCGHQPDKIILVSEAVRRAQVAPQYSFDTAAGGRASLSLVAMKGAVGCELLSHTFDRCLQYWDEYALSQRWADVDWDNIQCRQDWDRWFFNARTLWDAVKDCLAPRGGGRTAYLIDVKDPEFVNPLPIWMQGWHQQGHLVYGYHVPTWSEIAASECVAVNTHSRQWSQPWHSIVIAEVDKLSEPVATTASTHVMQGHFRGLLDARYGLLLAEVSRAPSTVFVALRPLLPDDSASSARPAVQRCPHPGPPSARPPPREPRTHPTPHPPAQHHPP